MLMVFTNYNLANNMYMYNNLLKIIKIQYTNFMLMWTSNFKTYYTCSIGNLFVGTFVTLP